MGYNLYINGTRTDKYNNKTITSIALNGTNYNVEPLLSCTVSGLGDSNTSNVTFVNNTISSWTPDIITQDNMTFVKFPTFYRKVNTVTSNQITSFSIANYKVDNDYEPYPCFIKEDGETIMDYILVAQILSDSTANIATARSTSRAYGTGYQMFDWSMWRLFQDLAICKLETINTNNGNGISSLLGLNFISDNYNKYEFIDGIIQGTSKWWVSYKPTSYTSVTSTASIPNDYIQIEGYSITKSQTYNGPEIKSLGYDSSNKFVNFVKDGYNIGYQENYTTYYCDSYTTANIERNADISTCIATKNKFAGVFNLRAESGNSCYYRVCYRPVND